MVRILHNIAQKRRSRVHYIHYNVDVAIVKQVSESRATRGDYHGQATTSRRGNFFELSAVQISKEQRSLRPCRAPVLLINAWVNMPIRNEDIEQTIVVVV